MTGGNFGAGDIPGTATSSTPAGVPSAANVTQNSTSGSGASTGQIAGGVVGGLAGLSLLLIGALLFLRWYKRKRNAASSALSSGGAAPGNGAGGPETAEAATGAGAGVAGAAATGAGAAGFMKRFSQRSPQPPPPAAGERGFQRISGRKLPSQFSPGAQGPSNSGTRTYPSGSSAYPSGGTFLSDATAATAAQSDPFADPEVSTSASSGAGAMTALPSHETNSPPGEERFMPGPARTPVVHQAGDPRSSHLAAPSGPAFPRQLGRSSPALGRPSSYDSSRGSRFTEDVA
ncbi:MAG: hypothetical protein M1828_005001 [Chrysothrix sp. TS-e1954]|nr:MAG: hypothetical protein M1828_005001 [Chrysothrix sp. TS-e1954]